MNFLANLINGISLGSVYAIIALGYTMVYGIAKMLNFAHGDVIMVGAYVAFTVISTMHLPIWAGVLLSILICTALGMTIEKIAYRPLRNAGSPLAVLITAIGVSYLLQNLGLLIFGADISAGIRSGISVCGDVVIPSLFPFMILAEFITLSGAADTLSKPLSPFTKFIAFASVLHRTS